MTRATKTRSALFTSIISLLLSVSMLVGTTFAWFTDVASTSVTSIQSGELKIDLEMYDEATESWVLAEGKTLEFVTADGRIDNILWEPGCTYELPKLRIVNHSNLALKYEIVITGIKGDAKLNEAIEWTITEDDADLTQSGIMLPTDKMSGEIVIKGHMREDAGNEYQGLTIDGIGITVYATQLTHEQDSIGPDYDLNAPTIIKISGDATETVYTNLNDAIAAAEDGATIKVSGPAKYTIPKVANQTFDFKEITIEGDGEAAVVFEGEGANNTVANVTLKNLTVIDKTVSTLDKENSWEFGYLEMANVTAENVVFENGIMIDGGTTFASLPLCIPGHIGCNTVRIFPEHTDTQSLG